MTLQEAIELLYFRRKAEFPPRNQDFWNAVALGEEALKAYAQAQRLGLPLRCELLPGQTEE